MAAYLGETAFPTNTGIKGMLLLDYFAAHAPEPTKDDILMESSRDTRRTYVQIVTELKYKYAIGMMEARKALGLGL
jgi:hypothetical protein